MGVPPPTLPTSTPDTPYSVLVTVYAGDVPDEFDAALESIVEQTYPPDEVVVVADGPLTDSLNEVLERYRSAHSEEFGVHRRPENRGRGEAAAAGVEDCTNDFVGLMSADDYSVLSRFERQVAFLENNPEVDVVGGYVSEFSSDPDDTQLIRSVPETPEEIHEFAKFRSPMNEVTVMFRKGAVLSAGNYRTLDRMEDYDLWVRLLQDGATLANVPEVLVKMRGGDELFARRGGLEYLQEEFRQQLAFLRAGFISTPRFLLNLLVRVPPRAAPNAVRSWMYRRFVREEPGTVGENW